MEVFIIILIILGVMTLIAIILYAYNFKETIIKSTVSSASEEMDQYYYLPQASLQLKAIATIMVEKSATTKKIISHKLVQLSFEPSIHIGPDPESRVSVVYEGNWFTNDEFQFSTSHGLLDNVKAISEDRLSNIIAQVTQTPSVSQSKERTALFMDEKISVQPLVIEVMQVDRVFTITSKELCENEINRDWVIPIKGIHDGTEKTSNGSFNLKNSQSFQYNNQSGISYKGLLTRPLVEQTWTLNMPGFEKVSFTCLVPDTSALIKVPVVRSHFIKRQHFPKFQNGILLENAIFKPSEFEGMVSIPINILKAIVSIPAQLLQFKIARLKQESEYEKALTELLKVRDESLLRQRASELSKLTSEVEVLKKFIEETSADEPESIPEKNLPQLGKLPPLQEENFEIADWDTSVKNGFVNDSINELPQIETTHDWSNKNQIWDDYDNFNFKTCVPASGAYLLSSWTSNANPPTIFLHRQIVMDTLKDVAPNQDIRNGCHVLRFLEYWQKYGMGGEKIDKFRSLKIKDPNLLKHGIYWFGGCIVGLLLPESMKTSNDWIYDESLKRQSLEGHAVCAIGYTGDVFKVVSFGKIINMDAAFYNAFNDETYMVLSRTRWITKNQYQSPTNPPLTFEQLRNIMQSLYADGTYSI